MFIILHVLTSAVSLVAAGTCGNNFQKSCFFDWRRVLSLTAAAESASVKRTTTKWIDAVADAAAAADTRTCGNQMNSTIVSFFLNWLKLFSLICSSMKDLWTDQKQTPGLSSSLSLSARSVLLFFSKYQMLSICFNKQKGSSGRCCYLSPRPNC